jgi:hypothetical protein
MTFGLVQVLIGEDVKPPRLVQTQGLDPVVNRKVLILHLVQHHRQHDNVFNCRILGVDDEDGNDIGAELAVGGVAGGAGCGAAVDVVAEVVLPDDLRGRDGWG